MSILAQSAEALFSDAWRRAKVVLACTAMLMLCWYHAQFSIERPQGYRAFVDTPEEHDGKSVVLPLWEVTHIRNTYMYSVSKSITGVPIIGSSEGLEVGDSVTVIGHFQASDSAVVAKHRIDHPWRKAKGGFSIIALMLGVALLPRFFGWSSGRVVLRG